MVVHEPIALQYPIWGPRRQIPTFGRTFSNVFRMTPRSF